MSFPYSSKDARHVAMAASLFISLLMLGGKSFAAILTGSTAILSDAAESVIHLFATGFAAFSLWYALQPPDSEHPYGHGKIAYFSSGFEGGLIFVAALAIGVEAVRALIVGPELEQLGIGLGITAALMVVNLALGGWLIRIGRRHNSLVLVSNGQHVLTDMWTSLGVLVGVGLVWLSGIEWLDPLVGLLMAANLGWMGLKLLRGAYQGLMERVDDAESRAILEVLQRQLAGGIISGYHQVRHRRVNDQVWVEYHLQFDSQLSLLDAHHRSHAVEDAVAAVFPKDQVTITAHLEPEAHDEAHPEGHAEPADPLQFTDS